MDSLLINNFAAEAHNEWKLYLLGAIGNAVMLTVTAGDRAFVSMYDLGSPKPKRLFGPDAIKTWRKICKRSS